MRRRTSKSGVKVHGLTVKGHWILLVLNHRGGSGIPGVAVKCVDIWRNTGGEGDYLAVN